MSYTIHTIEPADYQTAAELLQAAFTSPETTTTFSKLLTALRSERTYTAGFELVVKDTSNVIVGYGTLSDAYIQGQPMAKLAVLSPLAVLPDHQQRGIGRQLVDELEHRAFARGYQAIITRNSPEYFALFGYELASNFDIRDAETLSSKLSLRELRPGALRHTSGQLKVSPALNRNQQFN